MSDVNEAAASPGSLRERKKLDKLERIQCSAWNLFRRDGYAATTTRAVAGAAGVATGTIFLYAPDKPALLALAFDRALSEALARAERDAPREAGVLDRLLRRFDAFLAVFEEDRLLAEEFAGSGLGIGSAAGNRPHGVLAKTLDSLTSALTITDTEHSHYCATEELARRCLAFYLGTVMFWLRGWLPVGEDPRVTLRAGLGRLLEDRPASRATPAPSRPHAGENRPVAAPHRPAAKGAGIFRDRDDFVD
jgi:AcrR family transcriptional regulator